MKVHKEQKSYNAKIILRFMSSSQFKEWNEDYQWAKMVNKGRIVIENADKLTPEQLKVLRGFTKKNER